MRAVLQRVNQASVTIGEKIVGEIGQGWLVFLGVSKSDTERDLNYLVDKTIHLRCFNDEQDKMNLSIRDIGGQLLVVSQFTIYGDCRRGRRPGFQNAADLKKGEDLYARYVEGLRESGLRVETGRFQAKMKVKLENDGPVTLLIDSEKTF